METQVIGDQRELKKELEHFLEEVRSWVLGGFDLATSEDSISSYEANLLKFEVRFEELGSGAFGVEKILEAAKTLIKTLKNATETIISFQGCDYPETELVNEAILINLGVQALADYNEKPDPVRGKMISTFQSELNSLVQNKKPKEKMLLGLQLIFKDHTELAKKKLEALSGKEIKPEKKSCPLI